MGRNSRRILLAALLLPACGEREARTGDIGVRDVAIRIAPAGASSAAIYFTLQNHGSTADTLQGIATDAGVISLHDNVSQGGMIAMTPLPLLQISPATVVTFSQGKRHGMLENFSRPVGVGDSLTLDFSFVRSGHLRVRAMVQSIAGTE